MNHSSPGNQSTPRSLSNARQSAAVIILVIVLYCGYWINGTSVQKRIARAGFFPTSNNLRLDFNRDLMPYNVCTDGKATVASVGSKGPPWLMTHPVPQKDRHIEQFYGLCWSQIESGNRLISLCFSEDRTTFAIATARGENKGIKIHTARYQDVDLPSGSTSQNLPLLKVYSEIDVPEALRSGSDGLQLMASTSPDRFVLADQLGIAFYPPQKDGRPHWVNHENDLLPLSEAVLLNRTVIRALSSKNSKTVIITSNNSEGNESRLREFQHQTLTPVGAAISKDGKLAAIAWIKEETNTEWDQCGFGMKNFRSRPAQELVSTKRNEGDTCTLSIYSIETGKEILNLQYEDVVSVVDLCFSEDSSHCTVGLLSKSLGKENREGVVDLIDIHHPDRNQRYTGFRGRMFAARITSGTITIISEYELLRWDFTGATLTKGKS